MVVVCHQVLRRDNPEVLRILHEAYLARYVEMDGKGIIMSTQLPSFTVDGFVAVHCNDLEVVSIDYCSRGVYLTCDSWLCLGMDEFNGTHGACSRGCGTARTASWAVKFQAELRHEDGEKVEALFEGHHCTEVVYENLRNVAWHINAEGTPDDDEVFKRAKITLAGQCIWVIGWAGPKDRDATEVWIHVIRFQIHGSDAPPPPPAANRAREDGDGAAGAAGGDAAADGDGVDT